jgi:hypothetical protein
MKAFLLLPDKALKETTLMDPAYIAMWEGDQKIRIVGQHVCKDGAFVSTVFLGLDHSFGAKTPILFETLTAFDGLEDIESRYSTYDQALQGHNDYCAAHGGVDIEMTAMRAAIQEES